MKIKVAEATNLQLDWLVAKCEYMLHNDSDNTDWFDRIIPSFITKGVELVDDLPDGSFAAWQLGGTYSTDPALAWPIIERENIFTSSSGLLGHGFSASKWKLPLDVMLGNEFICKSDYAPTRIIAAMRCWVISKMGDEVEIPEALV